MELRIREGDDLGKLLDALVRDVVDANIYYQLFIDITTAIPNFQREFGQANTFWGLTIDAIREAYLTRLCRIFDQRSNTLNLVNLLDTVKANLQYFTEPYFRERLKDNAFVDSLSEGVRIPTLEELEGDILFSSSTNQVITKLMRWRGSIHAHTAPKLVLGQTSMIESAKIEKEEIEILLDRCYEIMNRYLSLYKANSWSRKIIGHDDYLSVLKFMRMGLATYEAEIEKEIEAFSTQTKPSPP